MEFHGVRQSFHHSHPGEEKQQMLNLNRRLETYLNRVKLLEEENTLLAKEIQALRHSSHGASTRRKGLEEELRQTRQELDAAWRDRVYTELEVGRLSEEFQALDQQRQKEAQAHMKTKTMVERSRKELEEEQRAQIWLREKVSHLEHEMRHLIQTHQDDVAHLEATMTRSRATVPSTLAQRGNQAPNLLQLGQEFSQRATRAWQEAADVYQGQLAQLEESRNQAKNRLTQVSQEKSDSQLRLQALEKEMASAQDVRLHLEKAAAQQRSKHSLEIQELQAHMQGLEEEKEEVGQQIDHLLLENRGLLQMKMSLGLEVATYRALLDSESLRGDGSLLNGPRTISITDAVFCPLGVKKTHRTQLTVNHKAGSLLPLRAITRKPPPAESTTPLCDRKPRTFNDTTKDLTKTAEADATKSATGGTPYPKILQDGAVENFRPQEVLEKVTYAEPLSPPNEPEAFAPSETEGGEEDQTAAVEPVVHHHVQSSLGSEPQSGDETDRHQRARNLTTYDDIGEKPSFVTDIESPTERERTQQPHAPTDDRGSGEQPRHQETSDSETEAVLERTFESRTSSPMSESEPGQSVFDPFTDFSQVEKSSNGDALEKTLDNTRELHSSVVETHEADVEEKLYPDGEEMDTWDSVIETKADLKTDDGIKQDGAKRQHAEPEDDMSAREPEREKRETRQEVVTDAQDDNVMVTQADGDEEEDEDDEEDSQSVCLSWRTELESDSYAQDNTLADTRPLIRYKSDETDANTQASHMDESESSEGDQEKKIAETGGGTWSEGKSKTFGTMEDLCEEVEGVARDEDYDLGDAPPQDGDVATWVDDGENAEEMIKKVSEGYSDEETEELAIPRNVDYDEELDIDQLVEQELENLSTDSYSVHFAQQQVSESKETLHLQDQWVEKRPERGEDGRVKAEEDFLCAESGPGLNSTFVSSSTISQSFEELGFSASSVVIPPTDILAAEEVQQKDQAIAGSQEKREVEEHDVSMITHADVTAGCADLSDFIRSGAEQIGSRAEEDLQDVAAPTQLKDAEPPGASRSQDHQLEDVVDCRPVPDVPQTADWEVLENPGQDLEMKDEEEQLPKRVDAPDSSETYLRDDDEAVTMCQEEDLDTSPVCAPEENDIFVMKDKEDTLRDVFSPGMKKDFWVSSLETGATYRPDDASIEAAEQTNQEPGFGDNRVWAHSENPNVVNGNSRVDPDPSKALAATDEQGQMHREVKQVMCRQALEGELVHSEESEVEGESWSSGEETV